MVIGSNEIISFDLSYASSFCPWSLTSGVAIPSSTYPLGSIMFPYQDIDPTNQGGTYWQIIGTAPSRMLVVSFYDVPYYGGTGSVSTDDCPSPPIYATSMMVLYESTNIIEVYIQEKDDCPEWNSGWLLKGYRMPRVQMLLMYPAETIPFGQQPMTLGDLLPTMCQIALYRGGGEELK